MPSFSAVLLAGGKSTRMGRDKALLPVPDSELLLWQRQLYVLEELKPHEIFWSGAPRPGLPGHLRHVSDQIPNAGPLAGISACLDLLQCDLLVVLAIDLPEMTSAFLTSLLQKCRTDCGAVIRNENFFEPLAAVYPKCASDLARNHLTTERRSPQDLIRALIADEKMASFPLNEKDAALFRNWNSPAA